MIGFCMQTDGLLSWKDISFRNVEFDVAASLLGRWSKESASEGSLEFTSRSNLY